MAKSVDGNLPAWKDVRKKHAWTGLLLGNGASCAIWKDFGYSSLYDEARSSLLAHPLAAPDVRVFQDLRTKNFEAVLGALATSELVCGALSINTTKIGRRYRHIKRALVEAVNHVHVSWSSVPKSTLDQIGAHLRRYKFVYSTNYDLLVYWSVMHLGADGFVDYFFGGSDFDIRDTDVWDDDDTRLCYLHGGLHLSRVLRGGTKKRTAGWTNLLDSFGNPVTGTVPLFVSEGSATDKFNAIRRSDYLSFVFEQFLEHEGPLVVFGHSLSGEDAHIVTAMDGWEDRPIAVSMRKKSPRDIVAAKHALHAKLPDARLLFFDAATHPLGDPSLEVTP